MRRAAIRSLGKIALVSEDPVRLSVYELLQNLTNTVSGEEGVVYNDLVEPILDVLDEVYETIENEGDPAPIIERERALFHQNVIQWGVSLMKGFSSKRRELFSQRELFSEWRENSNTLTRNTIPKQTHTIPKKHTNAASR